MQQGSEAYRLDASFEGARRRHAAPSFEVVEGRGLDAQERRGVSAAFVGRLKVAAIVAIVLVTIGIVRVGIYAAAVGVLAENTAMRTELKEARATQDDLLVERSVLSSTSRISRIATQVYGMVPAESPEKMDASQSGEGTDDGSAGSGDASGSDAGSSDAGSNGSDASAATAAAGDTSSGSGDAQASSSSAGSGDDTVQGDSSAGASGEGAAQDDGSGPKVGANAVTIDELS